jgi:hypothetical protein
LFVVFQVIACHDQLLRIRIYREMGEEMALLDSLSRYFRMDNACHARL